MKFSTLFPYILSFSLLFLSCKKENPDLPTNQFGIDASLDGNSLNRSIQLRGHFYESDLPDFSSSATLLVSGFPQVIEVAEGVVMYIPFTVTGTGSDSLCKINLKVRGASGYWSAPPGRVRRTNQYFIEILLPRFIKGGKFDVDFNVETCQGLKSRTVSTSAKVSPVLTCSQGMEGSVGLTIRRFELGPNPGTVTISYSMYSIPDRIDIKYNGEFVYSSGTILQEGEYPTCASSDGLVSGNGSFQLTNYDPAKSTSIEIYVLGNCNSGTLWNVDLSCPE